MNSDRAFKSKFERTFKLKSERGELQLILLFIASNPKGSSLSASFVDRPNSIIKVINKIYEVKLYYSLDTSLEFTHF